IRRCVTSRKSVMMYCNILLYCFFQAGDGIRDATVTEVQTSALQISIILVLHELVRIAFVFFFQAEDGIRDATVTGVQTCALPISEHLCMSLRGVHKPATTVTSALLGTIRHDARARQEFLALAGVGGTPA